MANSELFLFGDPRFLSGGGRSCDNTSYDNNPLDAGDNPITTAALIKESLGVTEWTSSMIINSLQALGQQVHRGRDSYHARTWHPGSCSTRMNSFLPHNKPCAPTLGVEIETYVHSSAVRNEMLSMLVSNWFHFEEDGSLDRGLGHELITEILPPRAYRDIRLWTGLQNVTTKYLDSWHRDTTGLHVHVGVNQFDKCSLLPCSHSHDRRLMGKLIVAYLYYGLLDQSFIGKIMLRKDSGYCRANIPTELSRAIAASTDKNFLAVDLIDAIAVNMGAPSYATVVLDQMSRSTASSHVKQNDFSGTWTRHERWSEFSEHHVEINMDHSYTIEFRRGKGTLNAISIHRMVEFASLLVRYAWKIARTPDMKVSPESLYTYFINNTYSEALKKLSEEYLDKLTSK